MGLFSFFGKDLTEKWADYKFVDMVLDLRNGQLNTVQLGKNFSDLEIFGKPDNKNPLSKRFFLYKKAGLIVGLDDDRISYFSFALIHNPYEELEPCTFRLIDRRGYYHEISNESTVPVFEKILGSSKEQYEMDEGEDREYKVGIFQVTIEFDNDGRAVCFDIAVD